MDKFDRYIVLIWAFLMTAIDYLHTNVDSNPIILIFAIFIASIIYFLLGYLTISVISLIIKLINKLNKSR